MFLGSLNFWAMFGAFGAQYVSDRWGRRMTFVVAAIGFIVGILITIMAQGYTGLMIGRMFVGLGVGVGFAIDPLYIAEVTPAKYRGELVTWSEIALNTGIVLGFSTGLFLGGLDNNLQWRLTFLLGCVMPTIMIVLVLTVMSESPRWLVSKNRMDEAKDVISKIYPEGYDIDRIMHDIQDAIARDAAAEKNVGWSTIYRPTPAFQRMLMVGIGIAVGQQAIGIEAIQYYLLDIIQESGVESKEQQGVVLVLLGIIKLIFIFIGGKCFDSRGRRNLFFVSLIGITGSLFLVGTAKLVDTAISTGAQISGLALYLAFFSIGMGPGAWLIPSEIFSVSIRAKAMSVTAALNRATATLMASTFLSTANAMGFAAFFCMLGMISILVLTFIYMYLPETKGCTLEEMSTYFAEITGDSSILEAEAKVDQHQRKGLTMQKQAEVL